ncbi:MAG: propane monooxygenase reductase component [Solirubrobacteraceae bacterium]|nr:propane monooxygenase reductase component [Solirubrobacteraceae bacterium]
MSPRVRFEPIGEQIECANNETVLDAAFRHGYNLVYGCREGQCSACKCFLTEGEVALERYSSFALSDTERANGYALMCRAVPESDLVVELLHYDPDDYRLAFPIREGSATVEALEALTHDIARLVLRVEEPADFSFVPGQYVDLHVPGADEARRSFSMANIPSRGPDPPRLELMIKRYPGGRLSGMLGTSIMPGSALRFTGPYGAFHLRPGERPLLVVAAGSGMAPVLSLLRQLAADGCERPVRFFYGARAEEDLFYLDEIGALGAALSDFRLVTVLSSHDGHYVQDAVDECLTRGEIESPDAYLCGPPAMVEAAQELLTGKHKLDEQRVFADKFTASADTRAGEISQGVISRAAAATTGERDFEWYRPHKRRATLYEDVTIDTQPSVHRHLTRGWPLHFEDGRGTWNDSSTALKSTDWFEFRDPGEQWERPFYQRGAAVEVEIESAIRSAVEEDLIADFSPDWVEFLRTFLQVPAYVEHGLWFALATAARDCLSDSVATCVCLQAGMKQRSAQALVLYAMDLEEHHGDFPIEAAKEAFLTDEAWQPTRRYLERLAASPDWGEVIVASNLCFEPILGTLIRRELGTRAAAASGDTVTTVLARAATQEWEWVQAWTAELIRFLIADEVHGAENRAQIGAWVEDWMPQALQAALALAPFAAKAPPGLDLGGAIERVREYAGATLEAAGLPELAAVARCEPGTPARPAAARRRQRPEPGSATPTAAVSTNGHQPERMGGVAPGPGGSTAGATYDYVGIVMARSAEGDAVADILRGRAGTQVIEQPAFWEIRAKDRLVIPYDQVSEQLGYEIDAYSIQHEMTTHYGRLVAGDDALMLFSDPVEAMEHLMS